MIHLLPADLLRAHIGRRTLTAGCFGQIDTSQFSQTEIDNFNRALSGDDDISRFNITMNDLLLMRRGQTLCYLQKDIKSMIQRERSFFLSFP